MVLGMSDRFMILDRINYFRLYQEIESMMYWKMRLKQFDVGDDDIKEDIMNELFLYSVSEDHYD